MPIASFVLMLLIGLVLGGLFGVMLRSDKLGFIINVLIGVNGAALGAFLPVLLGGTSSVHVGNTDYLIRALVGSFLLIICASLFRTAKTPG